MLSTKIRLVITYLLSYQYMFPHTLTPPGQSVKHPSDTNVLCKRLEKKLQKLSKLGSHLVEENKGELL